VGEGRRDSSEVSEEVRVTREATSGVGRGGC